MHFWSARVFALYLLDAERAITYWLGRIALILRHAANAYATVSFVRDSRLVPPN